MPLPANVEIPDPDLLQRRLRVFAMVDAIVSPEFRSFEFHPRWGRGETMGAFRNGSGDFFVAWISGRGAVLRGFDHECAMTPFRRDPPTIWPGLLEEFPAALEYALREPAFGDTELTFCFWHAGHGWPRADCQRPSGPDPDGAEHVLACLQSGFPRWAGSYYGAPLPAAPLAAVWRGDALTPALVKALDLDAGHHASYHEAPLQVKANSGGLFIDDFGRQRCDAAALLNRWTLPLERQFDFITFPSGQKARVPFDCLVVFSTNLDPAALADEAFLRRIRYKIEIGDPSEAAFQEIFRRECERAGIAFDAAVVEHLLARHYRVSGRPLRACQPRDFVDHLLDQKRYTGVVPTLTTAVIDQVAALYFVGQKR